VLFVLLLASTALPGFAVAWMFGGVSLRDVGLALLILVATVAFISAVGIFFSATARTSTVAALYTYAAVYVLAIGSLMVYMIGASTQNEAAVRPLLGLNPFLALVSIPENITSTLQLTLPFQYRGALDATTQEWFGLSVRFPHWLALLPLYTLGSFVLALLTGLAIDPCHRWRTRGERATV
jgi:hypothetical protein